MTFLKHSLFLFLLPFFTVFGCSSSNINTTTISYPVAKGTFIQSSLVSNWDDDRWQKEFSMLKEVGMEYLIFTSALQTGRNGISRTIYPSQLEGVKNRYSADLIDNCLRNAELAGFKVFLGLNFHQKWWSSFSDEWLFTQMEVGNQVAAELVEKYKGKYSDTLYGWYWIWEIDNLNFKTTTRQDALVKALNINIDYLNDITPDMPFMLCPFVNHRVGNASENHHMWEYILPQVHFREGDIFAPQDCVGAGGLKLDMVDEWFQLMNKAVKLVPGLEFWSDAETFDQRFWTTATIDRFIKQMQLVEPYVDNIITFAYSHYNSPFIKTQEFHDVYKHYVRTGELPVNPKPEPVHDLKASRTDDSVILDWKEPSSTRNTVGYYIYKNKKLIEDLQYNANNRCETIFNDSVTLNPGKYTYEVFAYAADGVMSLSSAVDIIIDDK